MNIRPVKARRISSLVFEQIRELIYRGEFRPGQQIPTERELANSMQVSRTSVRKAIDRLSRLSLLSQIHGQGTFVCSPENREGNPLACGLATDAATYIDLLEVRTGLECNAASLAALRAQENDLLVMKKNLEEMEEDLAANRMISPLSDTAFHMAITFSTRNPVLIHLTRSYYDFLFVGIKKNLVHMEGNKEAYEAVLEQHRTIYRHIENRDAERAEKAVRRHLRYVQEHFEGHNLIPDGIPLKHLAA